MFEKLLFRVSRARKWLIIYFVSTSGGYLLFFSFRGWLDDVWIYKNSDICIYIYIHVCVCFEHPPPSLPSPSVLCISTKNNNKKQHHEGYCYGFRIVIRRGGGKGPHSKPFFLSFFLSLSSTKNKYMKSFTYVFKHMHIITTSRKAGGGWGAFSVGKKRGGGTTRTSSSYVWEEKGWQRGRASSSNNMSAGALFFFFLSFFFLVWAIYFFGSQGQQHKIRGTNAKNALFGNAIDRWSRSFLRWLQGQGRAGE